MDQMQVVTNFQHLKGLKMNAERREPASDRFLCLCLPLSTGTSPIKNPDIYLQHYYSSIQALLPCTQYGTLVHIVCDVHPSTFI